MRRLALLLATIVTIALFSTMSLQAGTKESPAWAFPNSDPLAGCPAGPHNVGPGMGPSNTIQLITSYTPLSNFLAAPPQVRKLDTGPILCPSCATGGEVANALVNGTTPANGFCNSCSTLPFPGATAPGCPSTSGTVGTSGFFTCNVNTTNTFQRVTVSNNQQNTTAPFPAVAVTAIPGNKLNGFNIVTSCGNAVQADLLPNLQVQISPKGNDGVVAFHAELVAGGGPSFTVNTAGKKAAQIHQDIAAGFTAMGYRAVENLGAFVRVSNIDSLNGSAVRYVSVQGVPGMLVEVGNTDSVSTFVPAVSEWTIALFIGLVLLMGTWLLRRRLTTQTV
jgi:hypothetical protein